MMDQDRFHANSSFFSSLIGDGRPLLALVGICLVLAGGFALFLSASGHFLPHDVRFLGMDKDQLCGLNQCRIVHFMFHDRVSFGGAFLEYLRVRINRLGLRALQRDPVDIDQLQIRELRHVLQRRHVGPA